MQLRWKAAAKLIEQPSHAACEGRPWGAPSHERRRQRVIDGDHCPTDGMGRETRVSPLTQQDGLRGIRAIDGRGHEAAAIPLSPPCPFERFVACRTIAGQLFDLLAALAAVLLVENDLPFTVHDGNDVGDRNTILV